LRRAKTRSQERPSLRGSRALTELGEMAKTMRAAASAQAGKVPRFERYQLRMASE